MRQDWSGNKKTPFVTIGASNHVDYDRAEHDYYATEPRCAEELLSLGLDIKNIWECACGEGHLAKVFSDKGLLGRASDLIDRDYGEGSINFLEQKEKWDGWIVTNPPYKHAQQFCEKALNLAPNVAMFLKLTFLEGSKRNKFFQKYPPSRIYVYSSRRKCALNGEFEGVGSSAVAYAWFIWLPNVNGVPEIYWID